MINGHQTLPPNVINVWPEVFNEVALNVLPIEYLKSILITFKSGRVWEIVVSTKPTSSSDSKKDFENGISEIFQQYSEQILEVEIDINPRKIKRDVQKAIRKLFNKLDVE